MVGNGLWSDEEKPLQFKKLETGGSRMVFMGEDGEIYIYKMEK